MIDSFENGHRHTHTKLDGLTSATLANTAAIDRLNTNITTLIKIVKHSIPISLVAWMFVIVIAAVGGIKSADRLIEKYIGTATAAELPK